MAGVAPTACQLRSAPRLAHRAHPARAGSLPDAVSPLSYAETTKYPFTASCDGLLRRCTHPPPARNHPSRPENYEVATIRGLAVAPGIHRKAVEAKPSTVRLFHPRQRAAQSAVRMRSALKTRSGVIPVTLGTRSVCCDAHNLTDG